MGWIEQSRYLWTAEVYKQTVTQGPSGALKTSWDYAHPTVIKCSAQPMLASGTRGGSDEDWARDFRNVEWLHVYCAEKLSKTDRLGNLKDIHGELMYADGTVFEIIGVTPIPEPFGSTSEYDVMAQVAQTK